MQTQLYHAQCREFVSKLTVKISIIIVAVSVIFAGSQCEPLICAKIHVIESINPSPINYVEISFAGAGQGSEQPFSDVHVARPWASIALIFPALTLGQQCWPCHLGRGGIGSAVAVVG